MKRYIAFLFVNLIIYQIFASPKYLGNTYIHTDEYSTICISENLIKIDGKSTSGLLRHTKYFDLFDGNIRSYIILDCIVLGTYFMTVLKADLSNGFAFSCWEMTYKERLRDTEYNASKLLPFTVIKAESFITEQDKNGNEIRFLPEEFNFFSLGSNPWAVKKDDTKIIYLSTERWRHPTTEYYPVSDIVFVNGFVYPDKDYLYEQNSRAKRVRISYNETSFEAELQDTGNFQVVHLPAAIDPKAKNNIKLEILDYYPGTKYSDIVISGVYYMDAVLEKKKN